MCPSFTRIQWFNTRARHDDGGQQVNVFDFYFFFFRLSIILFCSVWSAVRPTSCFWLWDHSLCSCLSRSGVNSPSLTRRLVRELLILSLETLWLLLLVISVLLAAPRALSAGSRALLCVARGSRMFGSLVLIRRVIFWTPCWMTLSSSRWISRMEAVSGNISMKR